MKKFWPGRCASLEIPRSANEDHGLSWLCPGSQLTYQIWASVRSILFQKQHTRRQRQRINIWGFSSIHLKKFILLGRNEEKEVKLIILEKFKRVTILLSPRMQVYLCTSHFTYLSMSVDFRWLSTASTVCLIWKEATQSPIIVLHCQDLFLEIIISTEPVYHCVKIPLCTL